MKLGFQVLAGAQGAVFEAFLGQGGSARKVGSYRSIPYPSARALLSAARIQVCLASHFPSWGWIAPRRWPPRFIAVAEVYQAPTGRRLGPLLHQGLRAGVWVC